MKNITYKATFILIIVFISGILTGIILTRANHPFQRPPQGQFGDRAPWNNMAEHIHNRLVNQLDLNDTQAAQVKKIFESGQIELQELLKITRPRFDAIRKENHAAIMKILTPEQQIKFEKFTDRHERRRRHMGG